MGSSRRVRTACCRSGSGTGGSPGPCAPAAPSPRRSRRPYSPSPPPPVPLIPEPTNAAPASQTGRLARALTEPPDQRPQPRQVDCQSQQQVEMEDDDPADENEAEARQPIVPPFRPANGNTTIGFRHQLGLARPKSRLRSIPVIPKEISRQSRRPSCTVAPVWKPKGSSAKPRPAGPVMVWTASDP